MQYCVSELMCRLMIHGSSGVPFTFYAIIFVAKFTGYTLPLYHPLFTLNVLNVFIMVTGVYLTSLGPANGKTNLQQNNWDGRTKVTNKLEAYVKIRMHENDPNLKVVSKTSRNIFLYKYDLDLSNYDYEIQLFSEGCKIL